jgi:hypothetical protein
MDPKNHRSFGVFKPVGYVAVSFPSRAQARAAADQLTSTSIPQEDVSHMSDREMLAEANQDLEAASPLAAFGQDLNLVKANRALAERGYHWLLVRVSDDAQAREVADVVKPCGAERAQRYGHFLIEELIEHRSDTPQVAETPERGLDAQTPSGRETERAELRPPQRPKVE